MKLAIAILLIGLLTLAHASAQSPSIVCCDEMHFPPIPASGGFCIGGCGDEMFVDVNVTVDGVLSPGTPATITATGSASNSFVAHIRNVTVAFQDAGPYVKSGAGLLLNFPSRIALIPATQCPIHPNNTFTTFLCGDGVMDVWQKVGSYYPILTIYLNNGSAPITENYTDYLVTVVPVTTTTQVGGTTNITQITTQGPTSVLDTIKADFDFLVLGVAVAVVTFIGFYWQYQERGKKGRHRY